MKRLIGWMAAIFVLSATAFGETGTGKNPFAKPDTRAVNAGGTSATGILHRIADGGFERDFEVALDELSVSARGGRQVSRSVSKAGSLADIRRRATNWKRVDSRAKTLNWFYMKLGKREPRIPGGC